MNSTDYCQHIKQINNCISYKAPNDKMIVDDALEKSGRNRGLFEGTFLAFT
jgi:hypothetical protein